MLSDIYFVAIMALTALGQSLGQSTPSTDTYLLPNLMPEILNVANKYMFDGPDYIIHARTKPMETQLPSLDHMMYYNYYAASTYCPFELNNLSCLYCQKFKKDVVAYKVLTNDTMNTMVLLTVSTSRQEIVISYRGSMTIWNVILDFMMINVNYPGGPKDIKMHKGFYIATMSLYERVVRYVRYLRSRYQNYKIIITGHSLGAAMGRVTAYFLTHLNQFPGAIYELYTYGEPRVGNKAFADFMNKLTIKTARVVARADMAPHVAPTSISNTSIFGDFYIHPQPEYWINGKYSRFCDQSVYEDPTCSDSLLPAYSVLDHGTYFNVNYVTCFANQPTALLAMPFSIFEPVGTIPPLPKKLSNVLGDAANLVFNVMSPLFGR